MIAPGRALEPVGRVLDVALLHVHEARTSQLPRHKPKVNGLGADLAGQVEAVGKNVTRFRPGDEVFGKVNGEVPGKPLLELASFGEYVCVSEDWLALKPANLTFEEAAAVPMAGFTALQGLCDIGQIQLGQKVLINGAGGGMGTFAVQIAKSFGAEVTGVCSTRKLDMVRSIGADQVIDYTQEDFTKSGQRYDLILDVAAYRSIFDYKRALSPKGIFVIVGGSMAAFFQTVFLAGCRSERLFCKNAPLLPIIGPITCQRMRFLSENALSGPVFG